MKNKAKDKRNNNLIHIIYASSLLLAIIIIIIYISFERYERHKDIQGCLNRAEKQYLGGWTIACKDRASNVRKLCPNSSDECEILFGKPDLRLNCDLPIEIAQGLNNSLQNNKELCVKINR